MEYIPMNQETPTKILCCECGTLIDPNPSNTCISCLRSKIDITEGIPKEMIVYFCKKCERYQQAMGQWIVAELESRELMSLLLKKLKNLNRVHLVDANFIWTEPHSKRLKIKLTVQKEVQGGAILQQIFIVEYSVHSSMCDQCHRIEAKDFWKAVVQVRQKVTHKKTFYYLEQLLLKYKAHDRCVNVKQIHEGIDFFYDKRDDAKKLVDFLQSMVPCRYTTSKQLISHDTHNNTYNYKYTFAVEIVPICKDDVVCLPLATARQLGNIGQICVVLRVTNLITVIDPFTLNVAEMNATTYFRAPFRSICYSNKLIEYTIMEMDMIANANNGGGGGANFRQSQKHELADAYLVKSSEIGSSAQIHTRTHLGHLLHPGDLILGFDLSTANLNEPNWELYEQSHQDKIPDVIIVKKYYGDRNERKRRRRWRLRKFLNDAETASQISSNNNNRMDDDYIEFMEDLEEDDIIRRHINIYKDKRKIDSEMAVENDDDVPEISLQEMLDDLNIGD
ncbi:Acts as an adapter for the XPO1 CRM1-mediated export of the 60S ribosomal subunit [Dermatophagoides pteronyssinus]|uniref:Acts as an adapter for the XPO1 CRM1-mediated export of the 60S ribosomal subunit n=2 Tax=Dermatophagoides pteronyssinus TaxID=6956 RepID=A0ABQ8IXT5_DERPT|nr:60S ribosomal export protein NMD3-like [Dermatophagoides pteronyssinus]KAH9415001.1 Acts as an adapter for the XPO1 CRM1-mediated export of the 60S ribosomal subunit [Dermatophagoides pteronyssinus]